MIAEAPSVELRGVTKALGRQPVVRGVDLAIRRGEFFSLLGPSGCGKSTTLRIIAGFERADAGTLHIGGVLANGRPPFLDQVNMVFQHYALFPHLTVRENVAFGLRMTRTPGAELEARVTEMIGLVRLGGLEDRLPRQLSGGQQQRVALARALVPRPAVVLLDEPLGALDLQLRKEMQLELKALQMRLGHTFIYVTHDQEEALTMSDRIAVMHGGRVVQVGAPEVIYERPRTRFVASFIGESNFITGRLARDPGLAGWVLVLQDGLRVKVDGPGGQGTAGDQVEAVLRPERVHLAGIDEETTPDPGASGNRLSATVVSSVYFGTDTLYRIALDGGPELLVRRQNLLRDGFRAGQRVLASFPDDAMHVLEPEPVP